MSELNLSELTDCRRCPRLVQWRQEVAGTKRAAYRDEDYWGRPVPGFGSFDAQILIVGLAPGAHGANRTGRMFTGDRSGDFLFPALFRAGLATSGDATSRDDGLELINTYITSAVKCVPPDNKPAPDEKDNCRDWLLEEWRQLSEVKVVVCLGGIGYVEAWRLLNTLGIDLPKPRPKFAHGLEVDLTPAGGPWVLGCYHPSQQNTFTGRLTPEMMDRVFERARKLV